MKKLYLTELEISSIPSEIRLISYGITETTKGPYSLDEESARLVMSKFRSRGIQLFFDYCLQIITKLISAKLKVNHSLIEGNN